MKRIYLLKYRFYDEVTESYGAPQIIEAFAFKSCADYHCKSLRKESLKRGSKTDFYVSFLDVLGL